LCTLTVEGGTRGSKAQRTWESTAPTGRSNWWTTKYACQCTDFVESYYQSVWLYVADNLIALETKHICSVHLRQMDSMNHWAKSFHAAIHWVQIKNVTSLFGLSLVLVRSLDSAKD